MKRAKLLLILIASLLLASCSGAPGGKSEGKKAIPGDEDQAARQPKRASSSRKSAKFPALSLDFLFEKKEASGQTEEQRNIVSMEEDPAVVAERKRKDEEARKQAEAAAKKAEEARKIQEVELAKNPPPPQPPQIPFEFIGYLGPAGNHIGVFKMGGGEQALLLRRKGDKIQDEFTILEVGYETAEIGFEGFKETRVIPLVAGGK